MRCAFDCSSAPLLDDVRELAACGFVTGACDRNWAGYGSEVVLPCGFAAPDKALLTDPPTSGGLLVSCEPTAVDAAVQTSGHHGFEQAAAIGSVQAAQAKPALVVG